MDYLTISTYAAYAAAALGLLGGVVDVATTNKNLSTGRFSEKTPLIRRMMAWGVWPGGKLAIHIALAVAGALLAPWSLPASLIVVSVTVRAAYGNVRARRKSSMDP